MKRTICILLCLLVLTPLAACTKAGEQPAVSATDTPSPLPAIDALWFMDGEDGIIENDYYALSEGEQQELSSLLHPDEWKTADTESLPQYGLQQILLAVDQTQKVYLYIMREGDTRLLVKRSNADGTSAFYDIPPEYADALATWVALPKKKWEKAHVLAMLETCNEVDNWQKTEAVPLSSAALEELCRLLSPDTWQPVKNEDPKDWNAFLTVAAGESGSGLTAGTLPNGMVAIRAVWSYGMKTTYYIAPASLAEPLTQWAMARQ